MKLFISYRRKSWSFTTLLAEKLKAQIEADIFVDMTGIDETDFEQSISRHLRESDIVLVIITEYTFIQERIHEEKDWVRREIALALDLKKPIIPILVDGIHLPLPTELPANIQDIRRMEGIAFYADYFDAGIQNLANFIRRISASSKEENLIIQTDRHTGLQSTRTQISPPPIAKIEETGLPYKKPGAVPLNVSQVSRPNSNNAATYYNKGFMLRKLKRYDEALAAVDQAIHLDPNYAIAYYNKGLALEKLRRSKEAQNCYEKALQLGYGN